MTNEEAIEQLKTIKKDLINCGGCEGSRVKQSCIDMAIKALEERQTGKWIPYERKYNENTHDYEKVILPEGSETEMEEYWGEEYICSNCGYAHHRRSYCPHCGARMEENT